MSTAKPKYQRKKCEHGTYPYTCIPCGGAGICEHQKVRSACKVCKGSAVCPHDRMKQYCRECGGASICVHGKRRHRCVECKGGSICPHQKLRSRCAQCGGKEMCAHNRRREVCVECNGTQICEHGQRRSRCIPCGGSAICPHGKDKEWCVPCAGPNICEHQTIRSQCVACRGSKICIHLRRKHMCTECTDASYVCVHSRQKNKCYLCTPEDSCQHCRHVMITSHSRWKPYCFRCYCVLHPDAAPTRRYRLKEHYVVDALRAHFGDSLTMTHDRRIEGGCTRYRPDLLIDFGSHCLIIEIDEFRHVNYQCEQKREVDLYEDLGFRKLVFLRFNPDGYHLNGVHYTTPFTYGSNGEMKVDEEEMAGRLDHLIQTIQFVQGSEPEEPLSHHYLFYGDTLYDEEDEEEEKEEI